MSKLILSHQTDSILEIILNRPDVGNAANDEMALEIANLVNSPADNTQLIVIRGAGDDFCIGRDTMAVPRPASPVDPLVRRRGHDIVFNCYGSIRNSSIPVIGVVQGRAFGFGCAIAAVCDITIASEVATFQVPEMMHNILPTMVMSTLVDRVPRKAFNYLIYTTAIISAERALHFGIVSDVVPAAQLEESVQRACDAILQMPRPAILGVKEYARTAFDMDIAGAVDYARNLHSTINSSAEMRKRH